MNLQFEIAAQILSLSDDIYFVGGGVRDVLLDTEPEDIDFVIASSKEDDVLRSVYDLIPKLVPPKASIKWKETVFRTHTCMVSSEKEEFALDIVLARKEHYHEVAAHPQISPGNLHDDLRRRDFTINAIASRTIDCSEVIDEHKGLIDLENRKIKIIHNKSFEDDPIRILRGIRFVERFGFAFDSSTQSLATDAISKGYMKKVGEGRRMAEMLKIFLEPHPMLVLQALQKESLLEQLIFPFRLDGFEPRFDLEISAQDALLEFLKVIHPDDQQAFLKQLSIPKYKKKELSEELL